MKDINNLPASVQQRLLNHAHSSKRPFNEVLQYFAIERFLYRFSKSDYAHQFILKGALVFRAMKISIFRSTNDIDFLGYTSNDIQAVEKIFQKICDLEVEPDGMRFDPRSVRTELIKEKAEYEGVRVHLAGYLDKAKVSLQIDIGFSDNVSPGPIEVDYPTALQMPSPRLRCYPLESIVAEKFHAIVFLGDINSRMKDYYDLWILTTQFEFNSQSLQDAIEKTFQRRNTKIPDDIPVGLSEQFATEKQVQWLTFIKRSQVDTVPRSLFGVIQLLILFFDPILQYSSNGKIFSASWKRSGPWTQ